MTTDITKIDLLQPTILEQISRLGDLLASGGATIPVHLRGKKSDCTAIAMQALTWRMNPWTVAQKTYVTPGGTIGYQSQLINAVLVGSGLLDGYPDYKFIGDWSRVIGKSEERSSNKSGGDGDGRKYYVATYTAADEVGLGVTCTARLRGDTTPRILTLMLSQCRPRFSTQWATDPQQQICYAALKKWANRYCPGPVLGVVSEDDYESASVYTDGETIDSSTGEVMPLQMAPAPAPEPSLPACTDEYIARYLPGWRTRIEEGKTTPGQVISNLETRYQLSDDQRRILGFVLDGAAGGSA